MPTTGHTASPPRSMEPARRQRSGPREASHPSRRRRDRSIAARPRPLTALRPRSRRSWRGRDAKRWAIEPPGRKPRWPEAAGTRQSVWTVRARRQPGWGRSSRNQPISRLLWLARGARRQAEPAASEVIDEDAQADWPDHRGAVRLASTTQAIGPDAQRPALPFPTRSRRPSVSLQASPPQVRPLGSITCGCRIVGRNGPRRFAARLIRRLGTPRGPPFRVGLERPRSVCPAAPKRRVGRERMRASGRSERRRSLLSSARPRDAVSSLDDSRASRERRPLLTGRQQNPRPQPGRAHGRAEEVRAAARPGSARQGRRRQRRLVAAGATGAHWPRNRTRGLHRRSSRRRRRPSGIAGAGGAPSRVHGGAMQPAPALGRRHHSDTPGRQPHCRRRRDDRATAETGRPMGRSRSVAPPSSHGGRSRCCERASAVKEATPGRRRPPRALRGSASPPRPLQRAQRRT